MAPSWSSRFQVRASARVKLNVMSVQAVQSSPDFSVCVSQTSRTVTRGSRSLTSDRDGTRGFDSVGPFAIDQGHSGAMPQGAANSSRSSGQSTEKVPNKTDFSYFTFA